MAVKQIKGTGGLPDPAAFDEEKARKERAASARRVGAANLAMQTSFGDVFADVAGPIAAAVTGVATGGNPQAMKTAYSAGKSVGGMFGGNQEEAEAKYQKLMGNQAEAPKEGESDLFESALNLYGDYKETKDKEKKAKTGGFSAADLAELAAMLGDAG